MIFLGSMFISNLFFISHMTGKACITGCALPSSRSHLIVGTIIYHFCFVFYIEVKIMDRFYFPWVSFINILPFIVKQKNGKLLIIWNWSKLISVINKYVASIKISFLFRLEI